MSLDDDDDDDNDDDDDDGHVEFGNDADYDRCPDRQPRTLHASCAISRWSSAATVRRVPRRYVDDIICEALES